MTLNKALKPISLAVAVASSAMALPTVANAGVSAGLGVSNFYLFRGVNFTPTGAAVSGSLDYSHDSGFYAGNWFITDASTGGTEVDFYAGFAGEMSGIGYDIGLITYDWPQDAGSEKWFDTSELMLSFSAGGASFSIFESLQGESQGGGYTYYTLGYSMGQFGITYGGFSTDAVGGEVAHLDISFQATDDLAFTFSNIVEDDDNTALDTDLLFNVAWSQSFDL
jgi:uncharacterized protein (TIGR02001 family)